MRVIAIDGPAGSGKSTVAREVAKRLGLEYLDTGAMYRSVALAALRAGVDADDIAAVERLAADTDIEVGEIVLVDGIDATTEIRTADVTRVVSTVAAIPGVRKHMVRRQRAWVAAHDGGVVEGRDIGSVVFPDAELKVYLTASEDERALRRSKEVKDLHPDAVAADIAKRDLIDSTRPVSPLVKADDAIEIDTTGRTVDDIVEEVLSKL